jgi:hypothetical protein
MSHLEEELGKLKLPDDMKRKLPGDELIPDTQYSLTYHKNIEAPVSIAWRYLMQLGCDRAGWYSIDVLDNGGRASVDHLIEGWNDRVVGDRLSATPAGDEFFHVKKLEHNACFVIGGEKDESGNPFQMTWAFVLEPIGDDATHLITRARMASSPKWKEWLMGNIYYPPVHALMTKVQLKNIKRIAERDAHLRKAYGGVDTLSESAVYSA